MTVSFIKKEKSNLIQFPYRMKRFTGKIGSLNYEAGLGLLSGKIPKVHDIALEMVVFCKMEFNKHGIASDSNFDFQNKMIQLVEKYSQCKNNKN